MRLSTIAISLSCLATCAAAASKEWSGVNICRAAGYAYFYFDALPVYIGEYKGTHYLSNGAGRTFLCSLANGAAVLSWHPEGRNSVESKPILVRVDGANLFVGTDIAEDEFVIDENGIHVLE